jgi:hypothetical protein
VVGDLTPRSVATRSATRSRVAGSSIAGGSHCSVLVRATRARTARLGRIQSFGSPRCQLSGLREHRGIELYRGLLAVVEGRSLSLEELARQMIRNEQLEVSDIEKMPRKGGDA